jgi:hypothetical protein
VGGRAAVAEIRQRLFGFSEVLEVLATSRPDALVVVYVGRPRHAEWCEHLCAGGYELLRMTAAAGARPARPAVSRESRRAA